jgi:DNA-binding NtrC family response regulator
MTDYSHINVLVIDDDISVRNSLTSFLGEYGFTAEGCASTEEAREQLRNMDYHVCIVDLTLPGFSGEDLIRLSHKHYPGLRYIIHTGDSSYKLPDEFKAMGMGPEQVFQKPISALPLLVQRIKDLVDTSPPTDAE